MRKLNTSDLFKTLRIMRIAKIDKEIQNIINSIGDEEANEREIGINALVAVVMAVPDAEAEVYNLIGGIAERNDVAEMPIDELFKLLGDIAKENDLKSFFASVLRTSGQS